MFFIDADQLAVAALLWQLCGALCIAVRWGTSAGSMALMPF
jgi:hypothetical protein